MHENAWTCDSCGADQHTPLAREAPPAGWRVVEIFGESDVDPTGHHHYCSDACEMAGTMPQEIREQRQRELRAERARKVDR